MDVSSTCNPSRIVVSTFFSRSAKLEVGRRVVRGIAAEDDQRLDLALVDRLGQVAERPRRGPGRGLAELDRLAQVPQRRIQREGQGVHQRRLAPARDDDRLSGMGPEVGGHLANPLRIKLRRGLVRFQGLSQGRLGTARAGTTFSVAKSSRARARA